MTRRKFITSTALALPSVTLLGAISTHQKSNGNGYKTSHSVFTTYEIEDFCNEFNWIHVREFIKQEWLYENHEYPYYVGTEGCGTFRGIDGIKYNTNIRFKPNWIGDINKAEFKTFLKSIAGDYGSNTEHYYFYDVKLMAVNPHDCHGKSSYNVILCDMGVSNGKMMGYKNKE